MQAKERFAVAKSKLESTFRQSSLKIPTVDFDLPQTSLTHLYSEPVAKSRELLRREFEAESDTNSRIRDPPTPQINSSDNPSFKRFILNMAANARDKYEDETLKRIFDSRDNINSH
jgi:hypothetical protein